MPDPPSNRRAARAAASRAHIAEVALRLFAEQGFSATSTRAIAKQAGVSEGLVFHHFPTKLDLLRSVISTRSVISSHVVSLMEEGGDAPVSEQLPRLVRGFVELLGTDRVETRVFRMLLSESRTNALLRDTFEQTNQRVIEAISGYLARRIEAGELREDLDPVTAAQALLGAFLWFFLTHDDLDGDAWRARSAVFADQVVDLWMRGAQSERPIDKT